jgi:hypothetical protein
MTSRLEAGVVLVLPVAPAPHHARVQLIRVRLLGTIRIPLQGTAPPPLAPVPLPALAPVPRGLPIPAVAVLVERGRVLPVQARTRKTLGRTTVSVRLVGDDQVVVALDRELQDNEPQEPRRNPQGPAPQHPRRPHRVLLLPVHLIPRKEPRRLAIPHRPGKQQHKVHQHKSPHIDGNKVLGLKTKMILDECET